MAVAADTHRRVQRRLDDVTGAKLAAMIAVLDDPTSQEGMDAYNVASARVVGGAQHRSARLALAYMASRRAFADTPDVARALAPVLVTRESPVTRSPILRVMGLVGEGTAVAEAVAQAGAYARTLVSNDLQVAERAGLGEGARVSGEEIVGWRKNLAPGACEWCRKVSGASSAGGRLRVYSSPDRVPFHAHDSCSVEPVFAGEGR